MLRTGQDLTEALDSILAPYAVKHSLSKGRAFEEKEHYFRGPFQLDRDRIIHSKAFRRLKAKTQVFSPVRGDHFRDRLTHTLEVAQISKALARSLGLNEDLAEAIALAHDLGHTPFGHAGEYALDDCMKEFGLKFEHNEQSRRLVEELESPYPQYQGLNLTYETIEGLQKHSTPYDQANKKFVSATLEAQIVNVADEIAYHNHDLDDGIRSGILSIDEISELTLWPSFDYDPYIYRMRYVSEMMKDMLDDIMKQTLNNILKYKIKTLEDVYACKYETVEFSEEFSIRMSELRQFLYEKFYFSEKVHLQNKADQEVVTELFEFYMQNPDELPENFEPNYNDKADLAITVKDYISGMTDEYARLKHKNYAMP